MLIYLISKDWYPLLLWEEDWVQLLKFSISTKEDYENLNSYAPYPAYTDLIAATKQEAFKSGAPGPGKSSEGSDWIITSANKDDNRPLYILVWGSITDIAQALYNDPGNKNKIRVIYIGSWNTKKDLESRAYIYNNHSDLWFIENDFTFRGMHEGGDQLGDLGNFSFVSEHVKGHGALGDLFFAQRPDIKIRRHSNRFIFTFTYG